MDERLDHQHDEPEEDMVMVVTDGSRKVSTENGGCWGSLPDACLRNIFEFLSDKDRMSAGLACHHWHRVMRSPSLWRHRLFHFSGTVSQDKTSECLRAATYARSLGAYLETLEVILHPPSAPECAHRMEQTITRLLYGLIRVKARLRSLAIINLELDRMIWTNKQRRSIVKNLLKLIRRGGSELTSVSLRMMGNCQKHGMELLSALAHRKKHEHIQHLDLCGFFSDTLHRIYLNPDVPYILGLLRGLTDLSLTCSFLSDDLLLALTQHGRRQPPRLEHLTLCCGLSEPPPQVVSGGAWLVLVSACPGLKVTLIVDHFINRNRLTSILLPEIPLTEFIMTASYSDDHDSIARTLLCDLLPQYMDCLESLSLDLSNVREPLDDMLVELVDLSECLKLLSVSAVLDMQTVGRLLNIRWTKRSSLNTMKITLCFRNTEITVLSTELAQTLSTHLSLPSELDFSLIIKPLE